MLLKIPKKIRLLQKKKLRKRLKKRRKVKMTNFQMNPKKVPQLLQRMILKEDQMTVIKCWFRHPIKRLTHSIYWINMWTYFILYLFVYYNKLVCNKKLNSFCGLFGLFSNIINCGQEFWKSNNHPCLKIVFFNSSSSWRHLLKNFGLLQTLSKVTKNICG